MTRKRSPLPASIDIRPFVTAVLVATVIFYIGPLAVRGLDWSAPAKLALLMALAALAAVVAGVLVARGPARARVWRRMPYATALLVGTAVLRWVIVEYTETRGQLVSALTFGAVLGAALIYFLPGADEA
ncbi:MAG: hypothetical protein AAFU77_06920 [Myxococcota bacterium]